MKLRALLMVAPLLLPMAAGCASDTTTTTTTSAAPATTTTAAPTTSVATTTSAATTTAAPATTTSAAPIIDSELLPEGSEMFEDPQAAYRMAVDPEWQAEHGAFTAETEVWFLGHDHPEFNANVNVLTQLTDLTLEEYVEATLAQEVEVLDEELLESLDGSSLALLAYDADIIDEDLRFLALMFTDGTRAVVATLTAPVEDFDVLRAQVEPYLRTLHPAG